MYGALGAGREPPGTTQDTEALASFRCRLPTDNPQLCASSSTIIITFVQKAYLVLITKNTKLQKSKCCQSAMWPIFTPRANFRNDCTNDVVTGKMVLNSSYVFSSFCNCFARNILVCVCLVQVPSPCCTAQHWCVTFILTKPQSRQNDRSQVVNFCLQKDQDLFSKKRSICICMLPGNQERQQTEKLRAA